MAGPCALVRLPIVVHSEARCRNRNRGRRSGVSWVWSGRVSRRRLPLQRATPPPESPAAVTLDSTGRTAGRSLPHFSVPGSDSPCRLVEFCRHFGLRASGLL